MKNLLAIVGMFVLGALTFCVLIAVPPVQAQVRPTQPLPLHTSEPDPQPTQDFESTLQTTYEINDSGTATVIHQFAVKNLKPTIYLTEYTLTTNFPQLQNVSATSNNKQITPNLSNSQAKTVISVPFSDQVVGQGKTRNFTVQYEIPNMASVAGRVLEVQLPPIVSPNAYKTHTVTLKTPLRFGRAERSKPEPTFIAVEGQQIITTYDQSNPQAISAFFGDRQIYNMTLRYNLENNSSGPSMAQIALPPDTSFQRVHYHSLDPPPSELKRDDDGNWLATYQLSPNSAQAIYLQAQILLVLDPQDSVPVIRPEPDHTAEKKFWETSDSVIQSALEGKDSTKDLYDYVIGSLQYSYDTVEKNTINRRLGAAEALRRPDQAVCQEFTDVFVALARAQGTPARRLTGFAYTQNASLRPVSLEQDVLHAWPEYFDQERGIWKQVDPTWEATTGGVDYFTQFDLNHVVFAINGKSSTNPYPAGSYKGSDLTTKDVETSFAETFPQITPDIEVTARPQKAAGLTIPGKYTIAITNKTGQAWYDVKVNLINSNPDFIKFGRTEVILPALLPYQTYTESLTILSSNWRQYNNIDVPYYFSVLKHEQNNAGSFAAASGPTIINFVTQQTIFVGLGVFGAIGVIGTGSVLVFRQARERALRRQSKKPPQAS